MNEELELRMYGLVPYNLSPIQQGIQYGHAVVEYMVEYRDVPDLTKWSEKYKTFIILDGGTTNKSITFDDQNPYIGSLNNHAYKLKSLGVKTAEFYEPDLGDQLTAVVFLVDERVFNKKKYPDLLKWLEGEVVEKLPITTDYIKMNPKKYQEWLDLIGGKDNLWLRQFLDKFSLA